METLSPAAQFAPVQPALVQAPPVKAVVAVEVAIEDRPPWIAAVPRPAARLQERAALGRTMDRCVAVLTAITALAILVNAHYAADAGLRAPLVMELPANGG